MQGATHSADLAAALTAIVSILTVAVSVLLGKLLYLRRDKAVNTLTIAQGEVQSATVEEIHKRIERDERAAALLELRERVASLKADLKELRDEQKSSRLREQMLERQLEESNVRKKSVEIERDALIERLRTLDN